MAGEGNSGRSGACRRCALSDRLPSLLSRPVAVRFLSAENTSAERGICRRQQRTSDHRRSLRHNRRRHRAIGWMVDSLSSFSDSAAFAFRQFSSAPMAIRICPQRRRTQSVSRARRECIRIRLSGIRQQSGGTSLAAEGLRQWRRRVELSDRPRHIPADHIVIYGARLGAAVAAHIAQNSPNIAGLILEDPQPSLATGNQTRAAYSPAAHVAGLSGSIRYLRNSSVIENAKTHSLHACHAILCLRRGPGIQRCRCAQTASGNHRAKSARICAVRMA